MDERRLRKLFYFTEDDLLANRRGQFSEGQKKRLDQEAKAEQASARSSATILFVIAAAGLAIGLTIGSIGPPGMGRILVFLLMGILWTSVWAGKGVQILLAARIFVNKNRIAQGECGKSETIGSFILLSKPTNSLSAILSVRMPRRYRRDSTTTAINVCQSERPSEFIFPNQLKPKTFTTNRIIQTIL